jgi:hypothetical protein
VISKKIILNGENAKHTSVNQDNEIEMQEKAKGREAGEIRFNEARNTMYEKIEEPLTSPLTLNLICKYLAELKNEKTIETKDNGAKPGDERMKGTKVVLKVALTADILTNISVLLAEEAFESGKGEIETAKYIVHHRFYAPDYNPTKKIPPPNSNWSRGLYDLIADKDVDKIINEAYTYLNDKRR